MKLFRNVEEARRGLDRPPIVTLGVFDGVHLGHQRILRETAALAAQRGGTSLALTFDPHPDLILQGRCPPLLSSTEHKLLWFDRLGLDGTLVLRFDAALAGTSAAEFVRKILLEGLGAQAVVLGSAARFGEGAAGDVALLQRLGGELGFEAKGVDLVQAAGRTVSSTAVRRAVEQGDLDAARAMLGRPYALFGPVVSGAGRGRTIGFPTANLAVGGLLTPPRGVYCGRATICDFGFRISDFGTKGTVGAGVSGVSMREGGAPERAPRASLERSVIPNPKSEIRNPKSNGFAAAVNVGVRPTFEGGASRTTVEAHLLGFSGDLAGARLELFFLERLRDEKKFGSAADLVAQIREDVERARSAPWISDFGFRISDFSE